MSGKGSTRRPGIRARWEAGYAAVRWPSKARRRRVLSNDQLIRALTQKPDVTFSEGLAAPKNIAALWSHDKARPLGLRSNGTLALSVCGRGRGLRYDIALGETSCANGKQESKARRLHEAWNIAQLRKAWRKGERA